MRLYNKLTDPDRRRRGGGIRPFFLVVIVALACWAFWNNNQRRLETIAMQGLFVDETQSLSETHKAEVLRYLKSFKKDFGIPLEVHILRRPPAISANDVSRIYLDLVPARGRAYLHLPPLVRRAVGEEFIRDFEMSFSRDFAAGDWRPGLVSAILALRAKLVDVTR
ncbi:hypothetical protein LJC26_07765 [Desulfovibrio sp. OttesenSCG-928-O18]|nr:hypothetical protein [Desulfovibrio sp. OttesenSCG-928-O18]